MPNCSKNHLRHFKLLIFLAFVFINRIVFAQEICTNGVDDDGDGLIDLNDTQDCFCEGSSDGEIPSIIPNHSFEEMDNCCPVSFSQLFCLENWAQQLTWTSTDYFNTCDYMPPCVPMPLPDGDGLVGCFFGTGAENGLSPDFFEYIGTCLLSEIQAGVSYTLQFDISAIYSFDFQECIPITQGPVDVTLYGLDACPEFPVETTGCPVPFGWVELGSVSYQPVSEWDVLSISFTSDVDIDAILLGPPCELDIDEFGYGPDNEWLYCMFDDLTLNESSFFSGAILQEGGGCNNDLVLFAEENDGFTYQWYHEGIALIGETDPMLNLGESDYEAGVYQVLMSNVESGNCIIAQTEVLEPQSIPVQFESDVLSGCAPLEVNFTNLTDPELIQSSQWNFQVGSSSDNSPSFTFEQAGVYDISLTIVSPDNCVDSVTLENYIEVFPTEAPEMNYVVLNGCAPFNVAFTSDSPESGSCLWDFGALGVFDECQPVLGINEEGSYEATLDLSGGEGCSELGELIFTLEESNPPSLELEGPEFICPNITDSIQAYSGNGVVEWSNGMTGSYIEISEPGWYGATFMRDDGCEAIDSIFISEKKLPLLQASGKEACIGDPVQLYAGSDASDVWWKDLSDNHVVTVYEGGTYIAQAENECGLSQKEVEVTLVDCSCQIYVPNSFTPNGDGINDLFKPSISCDLQYYEILIYDRWGRQVFRSKDPTKAWNGTALQNPEFFSESQIFNYIIKYDNALRTNSEREELKGFVQIIR